MQHLLDYNIVIFTDWTLINIIVLGIYNLMIVNFTMKSVNITVWFNIKNHKKDPRPHYWIISIVKMFS